MASSGYQVPISTAAYHAGVVLQPNVTAASTPQAEHSPTKEVNTSMICLVGQETVNDIINKTTDLLTFLKTLQLPNNVNVNAEMSQEKRNKINVITETLKTLFQKVKFCYNRVLADTASLEPFTVEELIPYEGSERDEWAKTSDVYRHVHAERQNLIRQIQLRNAQLKEIIDQLRTLVWEINTMVMMRRS